MKTRLLILGFCLIACSLSFANPLPPYMFAHAKSSPPQIGIYTFGEIDFSGVRVETSQGHFIINRGVVVDSDWGGDYFIFDSTNTSGFTLDPEDGFFMMDYMDWIDGYNYGQTGAGVALINGHSAELYIYTDPRDFQEYWKFSFDFVGPYKYGNRNVVINEICAHGNWKSNSNYIELYNRSNEDEDISGWMIVCDTIYTIPDNTIIPTHGYYVIYESDFPTAFDMDTAGDNIYLASRMLGSFDQVGWSSDHGENVCFMRYPDGDVDTTDYNRGFYGYNDESSYTFENGFPTPGFANRQDNPGPIVIETRADSVNEGTALISWINPEWSDDFSYVKLVRSVDGYPSTPADGEIIYNGTSNEFSDTYILPFVMTYYTVFAYDSEDSYAEPTPESQAFVYFESAGIGDENLPSNIGMLNCYPNPFNAQTKISFSLANAGKVEIAIYDITGRLIESVANDFYAAGDHSVNWNAGDCVSGMYFAKLSTAKESCNQKIVLIK